MKLIVRIHFFLILAHHNSGAEANGCIDVSYGTQEIVCADSPLDKSCYQLWHVAASTIQDCLKKCGDINRDVKPTPEPDARCVFYSWDPTKPKHCKLTLANNINDVIKVCMRENYSAYSSKCTPGITYCCVIYNLLILVLQPATHLY